ncbi:hypothetical protein [Macrococcoides bohemicum]|nr:hypothetical protein [Macrococcus bohemicus]
MEGDYHFYIHQFNLAVEDEYQESEKAKPKKQKIEKVDSLFEAFGSN